VEQTYLRWRPYEEHDSGEILKDSPVGMSQMTPGPGNTSR
jgi:hypothetical protein